MRLKQQLRSHDLLARMGGDEFAVLLPMVRKPHTYRGDRSAIGTFLRRAVFYRRELLQGSASFGLCHLPEDGATKENLLAAADSAMYVTKNLRSNSPAMLWTRGRRVRRPKLRIKMPGIP